MRIKKVQKEFTILNGLDIQYLIWSYHGIQSKDRFCRLSWNTLTQILKD